MKPTKKTQKTAAADRAEMVQSFRAALKSSDPARQLNAAVVAACLINKYGYDAEMKGVLSVLTVLVENIERRALNQLKKAGKSDFVDVTKAFGALCNITQHDPTIGKSICTVIIDHDAYTGPRGTK